MEMTPKLSLSFTAETRLNHESFSDIRIRVNCGFGRVDFLGDKNQPTESSNTGIG
jgi:hypothetical protein